jgi:hypothetical protein
MPIYSKRKKMNLRSVFLFVLLFSANSFGKTPIQFQTIYGQDTRREVSEISNSSLTLASRDTFALVESDLLKRIHSVFESRAMPVGKEYGLCTDQKFFSQPSLSFCTAYLLTDQWLVTAKHCVKDIACEDFKIVQNYTIQKFASMTFPAEEVFSCEDIVTSKKHDLAFLKMKEGYGKPHSSPSSTEHGRLSQGQRIHVLGFPMGIPMKWATGQLLSKAKHVFYAEVSTFEGNSGSPVFDDQAQLVGVLVGGHEDFERRPNEGCMAYYRCPEGECDGEEIIDVQTVQKEFEKNLAL